jgi:hypothetical protein
MEISEQKYNELLDAESKLRALENGGVDNWEFYDESLTGYWEEKEKQKQIETFSESICEIMCEYGEEPAGHGCGYGIKVEGQRKVNEAIIDFVKGYYKEKE